MMAVERVLSVVALALMTMTASSEEMMTMISPCAEVGVSAREVGVEAVDHHILVPTTMAVLASVVVAVVVVASKG